MLNLGQLAMRLPHTHWGLPKAQQHHSEAKIHTAAHRAAQGSAASPGSSYTATVVLESTFTPRQPISLMAKDFPTNNSSTNNRVFLSTAAYKSQGNNRLKNQKSSLAPHKPEEHVCICQLFFSFLLQFYQNSKFCQTLFSLILLCH